MEFDEMTIEEIIKRFPDEWVMVADYVMDEATTTPLRGKVVKHSNSRDEVDRALIDYKDRAIYILYTGDLPAVMFPWQG